MKKDKLLTISIAAYNSESFIKKCIDSCIINDYIDDLEIIVINDGSKDKTRDIVQWYVDHYPESIVLINKENGGYGTTINSSLAIATGKYFKLLDSDDWFEKDGLKKLIDLLRTGISVDWIISDIIIVEGDKDSIHRARSDYSNYNKILKVKNCDPHDCEPGMWYSTFKTELLKQYMVELPSKRLYLDTVFVARALQHVESVYYLNSVIYCYLKGLSFQSSSKESKKRHFNDYYEAYNDILAIAASSDLDCHPALIQRFSYSYGALIDRVLLLDPSHNNKKLIRMIDEQLLKQ